MTEVYLLFYQATIPAFTSLNLLFQRQHPSIFLLQDEMITFIRKLCSKFLLPTVLQTHLKPQDLPYVDKENHLLGMPTFSPTTAHKLMTHWGRSSWTTRPCLCQSWKQTQILRASGPTWPV